VSGLKKTTKKQTVETSSLCYLQGDGSVDPFRVKACSQFHPWPLRSNVRVELPLYPRAYIGVGLGLL